MSAIESRDVDMTIDENIAKGTKVNCICGKRGSLANLVHFSWRGWRCSKRVAFRST